MFDLYLPQVRQPSPGAEIRVENITGPILLISSKMDTMWPSEPAAEAIMERLDAHGFAYLHRHLSYDHGSHLFVPMELSAAKFFRGAGESTRSLDGRPGWILWKEHWNLLCNGKRSYI